MRALVLGTPTPITARAVWHWLSAGHEIEEIWLSQRTSPISLRRDKELRWFAPTWSLSSAASKFGIRVRHVGALRQNPDVVRTGCRSNIDVLLSAVFPCKIPGNMLDFYSGRAVNLHPSLLPRFRGPRPLMDMVVQEKLDASGVTLHLLSPVFDAGDIVVQQPVPWPADGWFRTWEMSLADAGGKLCIDSIPKLLSGQLQTSPQEVLSKTEKPEASNLLAITENISERRARWLGESLGRIMPLAVATARGSVAVGPVKHSLGARQGLPPLISLLNVECDVSDARLSFQRANTWQRKIEKMRRMIALARNPLVIETNLALQPEKTLDQQKSKGTSKGIEMEKITIRWP